MTPDTTFISHRIGRDHAISWPAVFAGAAAAAALSLVLLILGTGLGLSSVSPWVGRGASASTLGFSTIAWITLTQLAAAGLGGYLAGRLRGRWSDAMPDEVYFRDTAHGFLAWAVATLLTAALLTSTIAAVLGTGAKAGAALAAGGATAAAATTAAVADKRMPGQAADDAKESNSYFVSSLFRSDAATAPATSASAPFVLGNNNATLGASSNAEATGIVVNALKSGALPQEDAAYLGQMVAQRTGMSQQDAQKRVTDTFARMQAKARDAEMAAREAADKARQASAYAALWLFVSLLLGAFGASLAATFGGRQRDLP